MGWENISEMDLRRALERPLPPGKISSAVLLPFISTGDNWDLLFEVRSETVSQPGEVSLPGGHLEDRETPEAAVVRETCEELSIEAGSITLLDRLSPEGIQGGRIVQPFAGIIESNAVDRIVCSDEVASVFRVPLRYFLENEPESYKYRMKMVEEPDAPPILQRHLMVEKPYGITKYWEYEGYGIWGLTARIVYKFLKQLRTPGTEGDTRL